MIKKQYRELENSPHLTQVLENLWKHFQEKGFPLISEAHDVRLFINEYWTLEKLQTRVTCTINNTPVARMDFSKAILNMLLLTTLEEFDFKYGKELIFTGSGNVKSQAKYTEMCKDIAFSMGKDIHTVRDLVGKIKECFTQFSWVLDNKLLADISILDIFDLCDADETLKHWILECPVEDGMSIEDVEKKKKYCLEYLENIINEKDIQPLKSLLAAGCGVRLPQLIDCIFMIGSRPDGDEVLPHIHKESWLRGIETRETFYNEAYISRCATILTKLDIKDPGSFQKMVSYLNNPNYLNPDKEYMCDTQHYFEYYISNQAVLERLHDRYMFTNDITKPIRLDKSNIELIGTTVKVRSPFYCNSQVGVCKYCSGEHTYEDNVKGPMDSMSNIGVIFVKKYISPAGQDFLSGKHNMVTNIQGMVFIHSDRVIVDVKDTDVLYANGVISVNEECLHNDCKEENFRGRPYYSKFNVTINDTIFVVENNNKIYYDEDKEVYRVVYGNNRKSKVYIKIKEIFSYPNRFENPIMELNEITNAPYIVGELLLSNMIVTAGKTKDDKVRPDWSKTSEEIGPIEFIGLPSAIIANRGVVNKFPFGYFGEVVSDPENYKPVGEMPYDVLYASRLSDEECEI